MSDRHQMPDQIVPAELASVHMRAIMRRWWLVVAGALISGALAFFVSSQQPKQYHATALVLLSGSDPANTLLHLTSPPSGDPERDLNTEVALVKLDSSALHVRSVLGLPLTSTALLRQISAEPSGTTNLVAITASNRSPRLAADIANAFAVRYIFVLKHQAQQAYTKAADLAGAQLAGLPPGQQSGSAGKNLRIREHQLRLAGVLQTGNAQLVGPASPPTTAASPRPKFSAAIGVLIGALLGALAAIAAGALDRRVKATPPLPDPPANGNGNGHAAGQIIVPPMTTHSTHPAQLTWMPDEPEQ